MAPMAQRRAGIPGMQHGRRPPMCGGCGKLGRDAAEVRTRTVAARRWRRADDQLWADAIAVAGVRGVARGP